MSFSASWGEEHDLGKPNLREDLALENAKLSPPLNEMAEDVRDTVDACADAIANVISYLPDSPTGQFRASAYGHVRQGESDTSTTTIMINEKAEETVT